jgi:hypothetical protein
MITNFEEFSLNESSTTETLHDRIKKTYKNSEVEGLVDFRSAYELGYDIAEKFDVLLSPAPTFKVGTETLTNNKYVLYKVECNDYVDVDKKKTEFEKNYIEKSLNTLTTLIGGDKFSSGNDFFINNLYIVESSDSDKGFYYVKAIVFEGVFKK